MMTNIAIIKTKELINSVISHCRLVFCISAITASLHIHDLTNNPLAIIPLGKAQLKTGYIRIIHPIDLIQIGNTIKKVNSEVENNRISNPLYDLTQIKNSKLSETFMKLKPYARKITKRWDQVGQVWKWIAGSPDAEDLRIINSTMNSLINNNNKQIMVNQAISKRIQEITNITNEVLNMEKERMKNHSIEINQLLILSNLDSLQNQIETLEEAILMAKHGIPSSKLLSIKDFRVIASFLQNHDVHIRSFEELLSQSTAQVMLNETHIAYMLKVPQLSLRQYEYNFIDSIIKNEKRILINQNYIIRNETHIYELAQPCQFHNRDYICDGIHLISPSKCIDALVKGQHSNCTFEKVYSNGLTKRISDSVILINDAIVDISSNCSETHQQLNGSFLIQFEDCKISINGEPYMNFEATIPSRSYYPTTGLKVQEMSIIDTPPAEYLQNLTLEHRDHLDTLKLETNSLQWKINIFGSISSTILITGIAFGIYLFISRRASNLNITLPPIKFRKDEKDPDGTTNIPLEIIREDPDELPPERKREIEEFLNTPSPYRAVHQL